MSFKVFLLNIRRIVFYLYRGVAACCFETHDRKQCCKNNHFNDDNRNIHKLSPSLSYTTEEFRVPFIFYLYKSNLNSFLVMLKFTNANAIPIIITTGKAHAGLRFIRDSAYPAGISSTAHSYVKSRLNQICP